MRTCTRCELELAPEAFPRGRSGVCKNCTNARKRARRLRGGGAASCVQCGYRHAPSLDATGRCSACAEARALGEMRGMQADLATLRAAVAQGHVDLEALRGALDDRDEPCDGQSGRGRLLVW